MLTATWAAGIDIGGNALGLPFFTCAVGTVLHVMRWYAYQKQLSYLVVSFMVWGLKGSQSQTVPAKECAAQEMNASA